MFDSPIFAPGINIGGKSPSIKKVTDAIAVSIDNKAIRFAENLIINTYPLIISLSPSLTPTIFT